MGAAGSAGGPVTGSSVGDSLMISVHGPVGALDLVVPSGATGVDLSRAYAEEAGLPYRPAIVTRHGQPLSTEPLIEVGVFSGSVLVALAPDATASSSGSRRSDPSRGEQSVGVPSALGILWFSVCAATAGLAGWYAAAQPNDATNVTAVLALLLIGAALGLLPVERFAAQRVTVAPVFGAAAGACTFR